MLFDEAFVCNELITYLGNKRRMVSLINDAILRIKERLGKERLVAFDGFSGSGCVSRLLKYHSYKLYTNDIEEYARILNICYLSNPSSLDKKELLYHINTINNLPLIDTGFVYNNYAPKDDTNILSGERAFYTTRNAKFIDTAKEYIFTKVECSLRPYLLSSLLIEASVHTNTSGVFKGFYKDKSGVGCFGGEGRNALKRILQDIYLFHPTLISQPCEFTVFKGDTLEVVKDIPECDVVYYDPPYNQHPYGSNYFMLNLIANEELPEIQDGVSGITKEWYKSDFNIKSKVYKTMDELMRRTKSKYVLVSYNNEGFLTEDELRNIFSSYGSVLLHRHEYNTFRGCRNLENRSNKVDELLWEIKLS